MVEITENPSEARDPTTHPRSAIFSIQLELRPDGSVRRTLVKRARTESGEEESDQWLGWNAGRLVAFIEQYAQLRSLTESSGMMLSGPIVSVRHKFEPITAITEQAVEFKTYAVVPADMPVEESMDEPTLTATIPASSPQTEAVLSGVLHIRGLETSVEDREGVQNVLNPGEPLHLRFLLDLSDVIAPPDALITYKAAVYAKQIGGPRHLTIAEGTGSAKMAGSTQIELTGQDLPSGLYRLMAIATLSAANRSKRPQLTAFLESGPVEVPNPA